MPDNPNCVWNGQNNNINTDLNDDLGYNDLWEPWKHIIISVKTATANITRLQNMLKREQKPIINKRGILRHTITIQIASNNNYLSIEFKTRQLMETFCSQTLPVQGYNITYPDKKKSKPHKRLMNISFQNIPPETPEQLWQTSSKPTQILKGHPCTSGKRITA